MDNDATAQPPHDPIDARLRRGLHAAADGVDTGDRDQQLGDVRRTAGRRRRRRQVVAGLAAAGVLVVGGVVAVNVVRDDGDDLLVSSGVTTTVVDDDAGAGDPTAQPATEPAPAPNDDVPASTVVVAAESEPVVVEVGDAESGQVYPGEALVVWKDGFLRFGMTYTPQPLPAEFSDDIAAQFPPEVVEFFEENGLPPTIDEASRMLSEAGLLDEVTEVLNANPEVSDAIYAETPAPPEAYAETSIDGVEWAPVDLVLPPGWTTTSYVVSTGDRLVVGVEKIDGEAPARGARPDRSTYGVASTTDLQTWDVVDIGPGDLDLPDPLTEYRWFDTLAANANGWTAVLSSNIEVAPEFLEPLVHDDEPAAQAAYGNVFDGAIEVHFLDEMTGRDLGTQRYSFEELGIAASEVPTESWSSTAYAAPWGGDVQRSALDTPVIASTAIESGFVGITDQIELSPDGLTWNPIASPRGESVPMSVMSLGRDVVALYRSNEGSVVGYRLRFPDMVWQPLDLPVLPDGAQVWGAVPTSAIVMPVEAVGRAEEPPTTFTVAVEPDYAVELSFDGTSQGYTLIEVATGEVVLSETTPVPDDVEEVFEHLEASAGGGFTIVDPGTGEVLVEVSDQMIDDAQLSAPISTTVIGDSAEPEAWLLATSDGESWIVEELPGGESFLYYGPHNVAVNGNVVVVQGMAATITYELP